MRPEPITIASAGASSPPTSVPELLERPGVEEVGDAGAGVELAGVAVLAQPLLAAHRARRLAALREVVEDVVPAVRNR